MRLFEILQEDTSSGASQKNIDDILTVQLPGLYRGLKIMAEKYATNYTPKRDEDGVFRYDPDKFTKSLKFVMGSQKARWYQDVFFKALKPALYNYSKSIPPDLRNRLVQALSDTVVGGSMSDVESIIIPLLGRIALSTKNAVLNSAVSTAQDSVSEYYKFLDKAETIASKANASVDSGYSEPTSEPDKKSSIGSQNATIESIIADVLSRIDKKQSGEIRNAISKSGNKLAALQNELTKRGIKV